MQLHDLPTLGHALSPRAYLATGAPSGEPHVVPVHPGWEGPTLWIMTGRTAAKVHNIEHKDQVALHWEVNAAGDGLLVFGRATLHRDVPTKRRLWSGVFDYDLDLFAAGGPESPDTVFIAVEPRRAIHALAYGAGGVQRWAAD